MSKNSPESYSEKLKDPRWQKKRLEVLQRDNWSCKICGCKTKTLNIHHLFYQKNKDPWEIQNGFLITLCEDCHKPPDPEIFSLVLQDYVAGFLNCLWKNGLRVASLTALSETIEALFNTKDKNDEVV